MKKIFPAILLALCLILAGFPAASAEDAVPETAAVTAEELADWAGALKARALETTPENDPADDRPEDRIPSH